MQGQGKKGFPVPASNKALGRLSAAGGLDAFLR